MITTTLIGPPGAGKSTALLNMTKTPGRYILAVPRVELIDEHKMTIERIVGDDAQPNWESVHSGKLKKGRSVGPAFEDAIRRHGGDAHCVVAGTHQGTMLSDLSNANGYHLLMDEAPEGIHSGSMVVPVGAVLLQYLYDLHPVGDSQWSRVVVRDPSVTTKQIAGDTLIKGLTEFDRKVRTSHGVYVNVRDWTTLIGSGTPLHWYSVWTLSELKHFDSVTIAAAGFKHSLMWLVSSKKDATLRLSEVKVSAPARAASKTKIYYFTEGHRGSTSFWSEPEGQRCLDAVNDYLRNVKLGYWSGNDEVKRRFRGLKGEKVGARMEGTNSLRHHSSCAYIYSSKSIPSDIVLMTEFGLTAKQIERAREEEHIAQFVMRGLIRMADFDGEYSVYLYDKHQAAFLAEYLTENGISTAELVPLHDAGIMDVKRERKQRQQIVLDPSSAAARSERKKIVDAERQRRRRERNKDARKQAGIYQGRGRPPKSSTPTKDIERI